METIQLIFSRSKLPFSPLVQLVTWSHWSHVGIVMDNNQVIESTFTHGGVKPVDIDTFKSRASDWIVVALPCTSRQAIIDAAMSQVGKKYDWTGLFGILMRERHWQEDDAWFCSELIAWAFMLGGSPLFMPDVVHRITPQHLFMLFHEVVTWKNAPALK